MDILVMDGKEYEADVIRGERADVFWRTAGHRGELLITVDKRGAEAWSSSEPAAVLGGLLRDGTTAMLRGPKLETRADGSVWVVGTCNRCSARGEVAAEPGGTTRRILLCSGIRHWISVELEHAPLTIS